MMLRRRMMGQGAPEPTGTYIYRIKNVPTTEVDTGIKLADTNKAFSILTEMSFPNAVISGNNWSGAGNLAIYGVGVRTTAAQNAAVLASGGNYFRIRYYDKAVYQYANTATYPYLSNDRRHRFAHWHDANTDTSTINLDGYVEKTTPVGGTYTASDGTLLVIASENIVIHALYIYDRVLTSQEVGDFISDGIIP